MRKLLIVILLAIALFLLIKFGFEIYSAYFIPLMVEIPNTSIGIEAGPIAVQIDQDTPWSSIVKLVTTVLSTYLGYKLINKYVK